MRSEGVGRSENVQGASAHSAFSELLRRLARGWVWRFYLIRKHHIAFNTFYPITSTAWLLARTTQSYGELIAYLTTTTPQCRQEHRHPNVSYSPRTSNLSSPHQPSHPGSPPSDTSKPPPRFPLPPPLSHPSHRPRLPSQRPKPTVQSLTSHQ